MIEAVLLVVLSAKRQWTNFYAGKLLDFPNILGVHTPSKMAGFLQVVHGTIQGKSMFDILFNHITL